MRFARSTLIAALASVATVAVAEDASDVLDLTKDSFQSTVGPESLMLVEFFAPWCGHCKALKPEYEKAATELKNENIKLAKVDCTEEEELCAENGVGGYPTLKVFRKGDATDYQGTRKADGIISYMKKQALPAISTVAAGNFSDFKGADRVVTVAFLSEDDSANLASFTTVAEKNRDDFLFGLSRDPEVAKTAGVTPPAVVLYRKFDEPEIKFDKSFEPAGLEAFIKAESIPLIDEIGPENFAAYAESGLPLAYYFTEPDAADKESALEALKPLAKEHKGKVNFVWIDAVKFAQHAKGLNLQEEKFPAFAIQDIQAAAKYPLDNSHLGKDSVKSIKDFIKKYSAGSLKPSIKSEPVPKSQDGPVHVLVADEFDKVVFDDKKDVLVEFYAPWCGHCKKLAPTYDTLGEKYSSHKDKIVIAKMDATTNDIPPSAGFQVQSFPTIKFKPAGSKEWVDFAGDRSLEGFVDFISVNAKNKVPVNLEQLDNETNKGGPHDEL